MRVIDFLYLLNDLNPNFTILLQNNQSLQFLQGISQAIHQGNSIVVLDFAEKPKQIHIFELIIFLQNQVDDLTNLLYFKPENQDIQNVFSLQIKDKSIYLK